MNAYLPNRRDVMVLGLGGVALAACGDGNPQTASGSVTTLKHDATVLNRGNGAEPKSLDPHYIDGIWESQISGDLTMGLVTEDAEAKPIPGAAERWEMSADGLSWTFYLRDHQWSDGKPVTADDFVFAWRRILDPKTAAPYAYYLYPIKNARAVNTGKLSGTALGIRAVDARTLIVSLENPTPYLIEFLTHQTTYPVPRHVVEAKGKAWAQPGNYVGNGPYLLKEWIPNDHVTLVKNPRFYDAAGVKIETVNFYPTSDADAALKRLRAGELDVQDPIPVAQIDWLRANMAQQLKIQASLVVSYATFNLTKTSVSDVRVREALSLAYDRETMTSKILKLGQVPAYSLVPPGTANYPGTAHLSFKDMPQAARLERAKSLMNAAGYTAEKPLRVTYATSNSSNSRRSIAAVQQMWRQIFVDLEIVQSDTQINYQKLQEGDFEIGGAGWVADYNDAANFLDLLRTGGGNNYGRYSNARFDSLMEQAAAETDLAKRAELLTAAEQLALDEHALLPTLFGVTTALVHTYVKGWVPNGKETHRTRWLSIDASPA